MPLHKISPSHEGAMFTRASVVMPKVEIGKLDRMRKRRSGERSACVQPIYNALCVLDLCIGGGNDFFTLLVDSVNQRLRMALSADLLHIDLGLQIVGTTCCNL